MFFFSREKIEKLIIELNNKLKDEIVSNFSKSIEDIKERFSKLNNIEEYLKNLKNELDELTEKTSINEIEKLSKNLVNKFKNLTNEEASINKIEKLSSDFVNKLETLTNDSFVNNIQEVSKELLSKFNELTSEKGIIKKIEEASEELVKASQEIKTNIYESIKNQIPDLFEDLRIIKNLKEELEFAKEKKNLEEKISNLKNQLEEKQKEFEFLSSEKIKIEEEKNNLKNQLEEKQKEFEFLSSEKIKIEEEKNNLKNQLEEKQKEFEFLSSEKIKIEEEKNNLKNQLEEKQNEVQRLSLEKIKIEEEKNTEINNFKEYILDEVKSEIEIYKKLDELKQEFDFNLNKLNLKPNTFKEIRELKEKIKNIQFNTVILELANKNLNNLEVLEKINQKLQPEYSLIIPKIGEKIDNTIHNSTKFTKKEGEKRGIILKSLYIGLKKGDKIVKLADVEVTQ
ncbi:MAG: hypothetical protein KatS3mg068_1357 [Candidatus Sericytochromatia bacterium]|nr:MAG: hypothetical protein KatS3mg068_1357 [Candidatus Sericytochromatia bacterium]